MGVRTIRTRAWGRQTRASRVPVDELAESEQDRRGGPRV